MLTIADDLSAFTLAAGEPFVLDLRFRDPGGAVTPLAGRAFVLSFHDFDRVTRDAIPGEIMTDADGDHVRFARDGRLSGSLYGWPLVAELAERYRHGREVIARGQLTILPSAGDVASLDGAGIAGHALRVTIRSGADGAAPAFTQARIPLHASPPMMLAALSLPDAVWTVGDVVDLTVAGTTAGAQVTATLPAGLTIDGGRIAGTPTTPGPAEIVLVETLEGAGNSPRTTVIAITIAAPVVADAVLPANTIGPVDLGTQTAIGLRMMAAEPYMVGARFRRARNTADFWFRMKDAGNGLIFRIIDDDHYRLIRIINGVQTEIGGYEYRTFAPSLVAAPGNAFLELRVAINGAAALYQDGVQVSATIDAAFLNVIQPDRGNGVRFVVTIGPAMPNVTAGALVAPLVIGTATIDPATRQIDLDIAYAGTPDAYDVAVNDGDWASARTLSSARAGQAVLRLPALAAGVAGKVAITLRQRNAPDIRASTSVTI
jgi:hypothetical protein